jgi:hypothetical protein
MDPLSTAQAALGRVVVIACWQISLSSRGESLGLRGRADQVSVPTSAGRVGDQDGHATGYGLRCRTCFSLAER